MSALVSKVVVPVDDQVAALEFWTQRMEFEVALDAPYGEERWLEVKHPQQSLSLVLSLREEWEPRREVPAHLPEATVMFDSDDIHETYRRLSERGVKFPQPPVQQPFGWWALFEDEQGVRYALSQREVEE